MLKFFNNFDRFIHRMLEAMCSLFLASMVGFTLYNVIMRYVFNNPPVWGDLLTVLSNIWLMFIALSLTARDNEHIALNLIYEKLPDRLSLYIRQFWKLMIMVIGIVLMIYGVELVEVCVGSIGKCGILKLVSKVLSSKRIICQRNTQLQSYR
jgi:TRAP-type C4-dicarboxylate transport system permease small subunit